MPSLRNRFQPTLTFSPRPRRSLQRATLFAHLAALPGEQKAVITCQVLDASNPRSRIRGARRGYIWVPTRTIWVSGWGSNNDTGNRDAYRCSPLRYCTGIRPRPSPFQHPSCGVDLRLGAHSPAADGIPPKSTGHRAQSTV